MEDDRKSHDRSSSPRKQDAGAGSPTGLEIEAGFQKWLAFARESGRHPQARASRQSSALERAEAIDAEERLLVRLTADWDATSFFQSHTSGRPDFTKGSEHFVVRYSNRAAARVLKATIPGKYGRWEYTPTIYLNSLRLLQTFAPSLRIHIHGAMLTDAKPTIMTSMQYIPGRHPHPKQVENYLFDLGWERFHDESQTLDFEHKSLRQIIRDAHPLNWVYQAASKAMVPVDISIEDY